MSTRRTVLLLGVPIDAVTAAEGVARIREFLETPGRRHVVTPNSEMLVASAKSAAFRETLQTADLALPDSAGLLFAARLTGQHLPARVTGVDTVQAVCATLDGACPVFLLGAAPGVAERAAAALHAQNPKLVVAGTYAGSPRPEDAPEIRKRIAAAGPRLLLVAFGAPAQDLWITEQLPLLPTVRVAMGVGGTFDFLSRVQVRAPSWLRRLHLEWLWRVIQEPRRIGRILNAVVVFPLLVLRHGRAAPVPMGGPS